MRHGFSDIEWKQAIEQTTNILMDVARDNTYPIITYSDLAEQITCIDLQPHDKRMGILLGEISRAEHAEGRGMLSVLVVHKRGDLKPNKGFFELAKDLGEDVSDEPAFWLSEWNKVQTYWATE